MDRKDRKCTLKVSFNKETILIGFCYYYKGSVITIWEVVVVVVVHGSCWLEMNSTLTPFFQSVRWMRSAALFLEIIEPKDLLLNSSLKVFLLVPREPGNLFVIKKGSKKSPKVPAAQLQCLLGSS